MKNNNKILYISANGFLGGAEKVICNIIQESLENGNSNFDVLFFSKGEASEFCKELGANVLILPISFRLRQPIQLLKACLILRKLIKSNNYKFIHSTMPYVHIVTSLATVFLSVKKIWFQHGPIGKILDQVGLFFSVDRIYFNSTFLEKEHLKLFGSSIHKSKHRILSLGVRNPNQNLDEVEKIKEKYNTKKNILLLSAGRLTPTKGQDKLIIAFSEILKIHSNLKLLIIGDCGVRGDEEYKRKLEELILKDNIEEDVFY